MPLLVCSAESDNVTCIQAMLSKISKVIMMVIIVLWSMAATALVPPAVNLALDNHSNETLAHVYPWTNSSRCQRSTSRCIVQTITLYYSQEVIRASEQRFFFRSNKAPGGAKQEPFLFWPGGFQAYSEEICCKVRS